MIITLAGAPALSRFRQEKLLRSVQEALPHCLAVTAQYQHFIELEAELSTPQQHTLEQLLEYGPSAEHIEANANALGFTSVPRVGTITPWSTKATDIAHHCALTQIKRIERGIQWDLTLDGPYDEGEVKTACRSVLIDPMTEALLNAGDDLAQIFAHTKPKPFKTIDILGGGLSALQIANRSFGFALSEEEQTYLVDQFIQLGRNPTDAELMMFAQVNSEHCRHKIFNADWTIDGEVKEFSPFKMIRETHRLNGAQTLSAYHDNAAVLRGATAKRFFPDATSHQYQYHQESIDISIKVETHNHPTAISPFPGAATGSGGEIRDEGATGRGGKPKAGLTGFSVSHLRLPELPRAWEQEESRPARIASALQIMLEGPIGGASFNNEFGRPNITGYFRTFEHTAEQGLKKQRRGYHKPIMLAGGIGNIREQHIEKCAYDAGSLLIVLGGPAMLIGLGGGAASSMATGASSEELDFASVQRGNPEMQRRCQEVIDTCWAMGETNPIEWFHDVGAGGLSNALPELVEDSGRAGHFNLRSVLNDDPGMSPMQIWCNESQERYVLAIKPENRAQFELICERERALYAIAGTATDDGQLILQDSHFDTNGTDRPHPIDIPMDVLFGLPPKMQRSVQHQAPKLTALKRSERTHSELALDILRFPTVADKTFLVTIGDRSITGLIARDQMVGPWQVPVADVAVTLSGFEDLCGEAMAIGERTPLALINAAASGRMAVGESVLNIAAAAIEDISLIRLSANWMVPAGAPGEDANLYDTVQAVALELCPQLGISIPVGKDSMSMQTVWQDEAGQDHAVVAPLSLIVSAFAPVTDAGRTLTPVLRLDQSESELWLFDLGAGKNRLGGSILAQLDDQLGDECPDVDQPEQLKALFQFIQAANKSGLLLAYHDRSDGGLLATLCEMAFTSRCGLEVDISCLGNDPQASLFSEELGAVVQIRCDQASEFADLMQAHQFDASLAHCLGRPNKSKHIRIHSADEVLLDLPRTELHRAWSEVSWQMQSLRDHPQCAQQEYDRILDETDSGLFASLSFDPQELISADLIAKSGRPKVAILREQGVNGQIEMAAAFDRAGFESIDVTMSDLLEGRHQLQAFSGFVACGGFSFGDVLGAGEGWAKSILFNPVLRDQFADFFEREDRFALGVCNGCQMLSRLKEIIPGTEHWPRFVRNRSEQFEARYVMTEVLESPSLFFRGMVGSQLPIAVAHGEGRAEVSAESLDQLHAGQQVTLRFIDNTGAPSQVYPYNPNGTPDGITGITNDSGRVTLMMPHPERTTRSVNHSWAPDEWGEEGPWMRLFRNARVWVG